MKTMQGMAPAHFSSICKKKYLDDKKKNFMDVDKNRLESNKREK